jgi:phage/plasmid-like protein (TIGR03299 family)
MHAVESMFSVRETPWHGLGTIVQSAPTAAEAIKLAGLDWRVRTVPLYAAAPGTVDADKPIGESFDYSGRIKPVAARAVIRESDGAILGHHVGPKWTPLQNGEAFDWFNPLVESGDCRFETAGSLHSGTRVWILASINTPDAEIGAGDTVKPFLLLSNSHDGSLAIRVGFTPIRVVCANTLAAAEHNVASRLIRVRHTSNVVATLATMREVIQLTTREFNATAEQYRFLASRGVNRTDLRKYVTQVLSLSPSKKEGEAEQLTTRSKNILAAVLERVDSGFGADLPSARGTWWGAYNGLTEYLSYSRGRSADNRLDSLWFGEGANLNRDALAAAVQFANAA